jgi:hypothetical protein
MKNCILKVFLIACFIFVAGNAMATPTPVEMISSSFHTWGFGSRGLASFSWDQSASVPVNGGGFISQSTDSVDIKAGSSADFFSASAYSSAYSWGSPNPFAQANAESIMIYRPLYNMDSLSITYASEMGEFTHISEELTDITSGIQLWSLVKKLGIIVKEGTDTIDYDFQTDHIYELRLFIHTDSNRDHDSGQIWTDSIVAVPEPSIMVLLFISMISVAGLRRWWKN